MKVRRVSFRGIFFLLPLIAPDGAVFPCSGLQAPSF
jgi:hypothetical protein